MKLYFQVLGMLSGFLIVVAVFVVTLVYLFP